MWCMDSPNQKFSKTVWLACNVAGYYVLSTPTKIVDEGFLPYPDEGSSADRSPALIFPVEVWH